MIFPWKGHCAENRAILTQAWLPDTPATALRRASPHPPALQHMFHKAGTPRCSRTELGREGALRSVHLHGPRAQHHAGGDAGTEVQWPSAVPTEGPGARRLEHSPALPCPQWTAWPSPTFRRSWRVQSWPSGRGARQRCCTGSHCPAKVKQRLLRASEMPVLSTSASTSQGFQKRCSKSHLHTDHLSVPHSKARPASSPRGSEDAEHGRGMSCTAQRPDTPVWPGPGGGLPDGR